MLSIKERQSGDVTILDLEGNVIMGGGSARLREAVRRLVEEGKKKVLLNFSGVKYIDSSGVGELLSGSSAVSDAGGHLKLMNLPEKVREVMTLSSLLLMFEIFDDEARAVNSYAVSA